MSHPLLARRVLAGAAAALLSLSMMGCGSDDPAPAADTVTVTDPWSRRPVDGQTTSALYGVFSNEGDVAVTAVSASSAVTDRVELHEVVMGEDGTMTMRERENGYSIPAGDAITLEPGGLHVMLLDIDPATYPDEVEVIIEFDDGSTVDVTAEVRDAGGGMAHMDHMDDS